MASKASESRKPQASPLKNGYLILYNAVSASIWASILFRTVAVYSRHGPSAVPLAVASWTLWAQSAAGMEVIHSLLGMFPCYRSHKVRAANQCRAGVKASFALLS